MTEFDGRNVQTKNHGVLTTWREVEYPVPVFAAEGIGMDGRSHKGFGDTEQKAITSCLEELEISRQDELARVDETEDGHLVPPPTAHGVAEALGFIQRQYAGTAAYPYTDTRDLPAEFWIELRPGANKIRAIKYLRDVSRLSLRSCKEIVEAIQERNAHA
jgi:ribosomal protein L7/L12